MIEFCCWFFVSWWKFSLSCQYWLWSAVSLWHHGMLPLCVLMWNCKDMTCIVAISCDLKSDMVNEETDARGWSIGIGKHIMSYSDVCIVGTATWHAEQGLCNCRARPLIRLCPSIPSGGLLLWARRAGDIDRLLHGRMRAVPRCQQT